MFYNHMEREGEGEKERKREREREIFLRNLEGSRRF